MRPSEAVDDYFFVEWAPDSNPFAVFGVPIAMQNKIDSQKSQQNQLCKTASAVKSSMGTVVWIVLYLIVYDIFLLTIRPLSFVRVHGVILKANDPIKDKVDTLISSKNKSNILVVGDSTADDACVAADLIYKKRQLSQYERRRYINIEYPADLMKRRGINASILNMSVAGAMVADSQAMIEKGMEYKKPRLVLIVVNPRSFIDAARSLGSYPVLSYFKDRFEITDTGKDLPTKITYGLSSFWTAFKQRGDCITVLASYACSTLNRPINPYVKAAGLDRRNSVTLEFSSENSSSLMKRSDKEMNRTQELAYHQAYSNWKPSVYSAQKQSLTKLLSLLKKENIPAIVINAPLSLANRNLLNENFESTYRTDIASICKKNEAKFVDFLNDRQFGPDDFQDGVHLNGQGAVRFWHLFAKAIDADPCFLEAIKKSVNSQE